MIFDIPDVPDPTHSEGEFTTGGELWSAWGDHPVELEVAEFLYGLVRLQKPGVIVECGSGYSSAFLQRAVVDNGVGRLFSYETQAEWAHNYGQTLFIGSSTQHDSSGLPSPDMVFIDSAMPGRLEEITYWAERPCTLLIHDAYRDRAHLPDGGLLFSNPRGLWVRQ